MTDTSGIRTLVSGVIAALSGWTVSRWAPDLFGRDTDKLMPRAFVVAVPETRVLPRDGRQRVAEGLLVDSTVVVTWAYRLRGDAASTDYDAMLNAEQDLVGAVRAISSQHCLVASMGRKAGPEGWIIGTATFQIVHRYALA